MTSKLSLVDGFQEMDSSLDFVFFLFVLMTVFMVLRSDVENSALDSSVGDAIVESTEVLSLQVDGGSLMLVGTIDKVPYRELVGTCTQPERVNSRHLVLEVGLNRGIREENVSEAWACAKTLIGPQGTLKISLREVAEK